MKNENVQGGDAARLSRCLLAPLKTEAACSWSIPLFVPQTASCHNPEKYILNTQTVRIWKLTPKKNVATRTFIASNCRITRTQVYSHVTRFHIVLLIFTLHFMGVRNEMKGKHRSFIDWSHLHLHYDLKSSFSYLSRSISLNTSESYMFVSIHTLHRSPPILLPWLWKVS
jgi:hypothetical protein